MNLSHHIIANRFPVNATGLTTIAMSTDHTYVAVGASGVGDPVYLIHYSELYFNTTEPLSLLASVKPEGGGWNSAARPVAMEMATTTDNVQQLYVLMDDPAEIDLTSMCPDCVQGKLWILDVTNPEAPQTLHYGGITTLGPAPIGLDLTQDLGNPSDVRVVGQELFLASHGAGLMVVDVTDPTTPMLTELDTPTGEVSGIDLLPGMAFLASGTVPLTTVGVTPCEDTE